MMFSLTVVSLIAIFLPVHGLPLDKRDVYAPPITYPTEGVVWQAGETRTVTWDASILPEDDSQITNPIGRVVLGYVANDSLNLQLDNPLAEGFELRDGQVDITVPDVETMDNYIVVLIGNSGNASPEFTIQGSGSSSSASEESPTSTAATSPEPSPSVTTTATVTNPSAATTATTSSPSVSPSSTSSETEQTIAESPVTLSSSEATPTSSSSDEPIDSGSSTSTSSATAQGVEESQGQESDSGSDSDASWTVAPMKGYSMLIASMILMISYI